MSHMLNIAACGLIIAALFATAPRAQEQDPEPVETSPGAAETQAEAEAELEAREEAAREDEAEAADGAAELPGEEAVPVNGEAEAEGEVEAQERQPALDEEAPAEERDYLSSEEAVEKYHLYPKEDVGWPHQGVFGNFDLAQLQRGFQVYREVCAACHALEYVAFRNLAELGYSDAEVKAFAQEYFITDGPDEFGEMFERPGKASDYFPSPYANDAQAASVNGGAVPPNLSLIVKAREGHEAYIYSLLTGYEDPPADVSVDPTKYYNPYFHSLVISMAPPLFDDLIAYADGTPATVEQMAKDVTAFLAWAAEPKLIERREMGIGTIGFLIIFTVVAYLSYRRIWEPVKGEGPKEHLPGREA